MIRFTFRAVTASLGAVVAIVLAAVLVSCSGAVGGPPPVNDPTRITILPSTATLYGGLTTTFVISGGTGAYIASSSDQAVLPVSGNVNGNTLTVMPNQVATDTIVTLTVRDTGSTPLATATLTVRPGTINNTLTITPTSTQGASCAPAICSGGDAEVVATLGVGGVPLPARGTRFEVVSGDFRFITTPPGATAEVLDTQVVVITDEKGKARVRIRVLPGVPNQTAILQITDLGTLAFQRASFIIAQSTGSSPGFFTIPSALTFTGSRTDRCADSGQNADILVFGGAPPYTVASTSSAFSVNPTFVATSGASFRITPNGTCADSIQIPVRDSAGHSVTVTASNKPGTTAVPALAVAPTGVSLSSCNSVAFVTVAGGSGNYVASSGSGSVIASANGSTVSISRAPNSPPTTSPVNVGISDGSSVVSVTVTLTGSALGTCPPPARITATPSSLTVSACSGAGSSAMATLSGGSGTYTASSNSTSVSASVSGPNLTVQRNSPSAAPSGVQITVSDATDSTNTTTVAVNGLGAGAGVCP